MGPMVLLVTAFLISQDMRQVPVGCMDYNTIIGKLVPDYGEGPVARGLGNGGQWVMEMWRNNTTNSWTILRIYPDGCVRIQDSGENYHEPLEYVEEDGA